MSEVEELVNALTKPKQWCCIFEHEGEMRHGTTDTPHKAAATITRLSEENARKDIALKRAKDALTGLPEHLEGRNLKESAREIRQVREGLSAALTQGELTPPEAQRK